MTETSENDTIKSDYNILVYKCPDITEQLVDNFRSVIAVSTIPKGTLLMLEHGLAASGPLCNRIVENNEQLFDRYHPRTKAYADATATERELMAIEKVSHNCFGLGAGTKLLNIYVQGINHSCTANSCAYVRLRHECEETHVVFLEIYAVRDILESCEITINYGPETAHNRDFECACGLDLDQRTRIASITSRLTHMLATSVSNTEMVNDLTYSYLESPLAKKMLLNQYLAVNGIYVNNGCIAGYDEQGLDIINNVIHRYIGVDPQSLVNSEGERIDSAMTAPKLRIFINILNQGLFSQPDTKDEPITLAKID